MSDKHIEQLITLETERQNSVINLIASENYVSNDVLIANGSIFTNKYAEGYPYKRYYGGNKITDELETLCQKRALVLFKLSPHNWSVNVQAHSGSPANLATLMALVPIGGTIMGLSLSHGGHLTHGHPVSTTGKLWKQISYNVDSNSEMIDYDIIQKIASENKPALIIAGYTAYSRSIDWERFRTIADSVGAYLMADISHISGLIATKLFPDPFPYADVVTTTTHKILRGPRGALIFSKNDSRNIPSLINKLVFPGLQGGPHMNVIAGIAVALEEASTELYKIYAQQVINNAKTLSHRLTELGWRIVSGGTDTHLFLVDTFMNGIGISGKHASEVLEENNIIVNMNSIPNDTRKPTDPSGIRIGTPAMTTKGLKESDMISIADTIDKILRSEVGNSKKIIAE